MKQSIAIAVVVWMTGTGCKQGVGERCQVNEDCESGMCSNAEPRVCIGETDNTAPIDGTPDVPALPDAAVDAPIDSGS